VANLRVARRGSFFRGGRQRRETQWLDVPTVSSALTATGGVLLASLTTAEKALRPFTIVRSRLDVLFSSDQQSASEAYGGAVGMCVVSDQAEAIGVTALPTPVTDRISDLWFLYQQMFGEFVVGGAVTGIEVGQHFYSIDSKAMRKVEEGNDVVVVAEFDVGIGFGSLISVAGRVLIKLH